MPSPVLGLSRRAALLAALLVAGSLGHAAAAGLAGTTGDEVDAVVVEALGRTNVPGASIALVQGGQQVYAKAYGLAQLKPVRAADTSQRYRIGSISKQFVATALLLLQSQGRLHLDDPLGRHLPPGGTSARVTLRQLLTHTGGVREYMPQDHVLAEWSTATTTAELAERITRLPLDFAPGERWRYSNGGYVLAAAVVERLTGQSLFEFMREQIFRPLGMASVVDADREGLGPDDAAGYSIFGLGPTRPAPTLAPGWLAAAGGLAMTAQDLAKWNVSLMQRTLLPAAGYQEMGTEQLLNNGAGTRYALGVGVRMQGDRRMLAHEGGVPGFMAENIVYPDDGLAIVVLTNGDFADAASSIAGRLQRLLLQASQPQDAARTRRDEQILRDLQRGHLDPGQLSSDVQAYYGRPVLQETAEALLRAGAIKSFELRSQSSLGGLDERVYRATLDHQRYKVVTRASADGRIEQYTLTPE